MAPFTLEVPIDKGEVLSLSLSLPPLPTLLKKEKQRKALKALRCFNYTIFGLADILVFHPPSSFYVDDSGFELALLRLAASVALMLTGPGTVALDNVLASRKRHLLSPSLWAAILARAGAVRKWRTTTIVRDPEHLPAPLRAVVIIARLVGYVLFVGAILLLSVALGAGIAEVSNRL